MQDVRLAPTANRTAVGILTDFVFRLQWGDRAHADADLPGLALDLARMPCGPLSARHVFPNRELAALVQAVEADPSAVGRPVAPPVRCSRERAGTPTAPNGGFTGSAFGVGTRRRTPEPQPPPLEVRHVPGMADELMRELAPLLAEDGIDLDHPPDLPVLQAALDRAVERRNMELFTPVGDRRVAAGAFLILFCATIGAGRIDQAAAILDFAVPESPDGTEPEVSAVVGMALGLLDDWLSGQHPDAPAGLAAATRRSAGTSSSGRVTTEILDLARHGRAFASIGPLIVRRGGQTVLDGTAFALAAVTTTWAQSTGARLADLLPDIVH